MTSMRNRVTIFRLCAVFAVFDPDREATWLFGIHRRLDIHAPTDPGCVGETDRRRPHGQVQMPPVGADNQFDNLTPDGVRTGRDTRHDVRSRNGRLGRDRIAAVLVVLRRAHVALCGQHDQKRSGRHGLLETVRYARNYCVWYRIDKGRRQTRS